MKKLFSKLKKSHLLYPFAILILAVIISIANFTPGTYLSGWDTLHPEFDYGLNIFRTIFGVFREEQGLGAVAAHSHMVELPRILMLWLYDVFLPTNVVRYSYVFSGLILGPIGMFYFLKNVLIKNVHASFLGALFYLLNLGTLQTFIVPFEMFVTIYAMLPLVFLSTHSYLMQPNKKKLFLLSLAILFTSPIAYAATLWYVFLLAFIIFFSPIVLGKIKLIKRFSFVLILIIAINSYWLLPNLYFLVNDAASVEQATINKLFSEEAFLKNKEFGTIKNILFLKSFYFDWGIYNFETASFEEMTKVFNDHLQKPFITFISYLFALSFVAGLFYSLKRGGKYALSLTLLLLFSLLFLINDNPPISPIFRFLQDHIPLFKEALRRPDDKILNIFTFLYAIFFAYASLMIIRFARKLKTPFLNYGLILIISSLLVIYMIPAFGGNLIHQFMRVDIPPSYFELFKYLKDEPPGRISNFPIHSPWGWTYYNWYDNQKPSYQGAGFLYFGISQSLLDRDFDRWSRQNEQYYREMSYAVYSSDLTLFKSVSQKYDITHFLLDKSIVIPGTTNKSLYYDELDQLFDKLIEEGFIEEKKSFGPHLVLYRISDTKQFPLYSIDSTALTNYYDSAYSKDFIRETYGDYISYTDSNKGVFFPITSFINNEFKVNPEAIKIKSEEIEIRMPRMDYTISTSQLESSLIPATILATKNDQKLSIAIYPITPFLDEKRIIPPIKGDFLGVENGFLSINSDLFDLNNLTAKSPIVLGNVFLDPNRNDLSYFDESSEQTQYSLYDVPISFSYCDYTKDKSDLEVLIGNDSITLSNTQDGKVCMIIPLYFIQDTVGESRLVKIDFVSRALTDISACLISNFSSNCNTPLVVNSNGKREITFAMNSNDTFNSRLMIQIDSGENNKILLSDISIGSFPSASNISLDSSYLDQALPESFSKISVPRAVAPNLYFEANDQVPFNNECKRKDTVSDKSLIRVGSSFANRYTSEKGSYCDYVSFPSLPHDVSYLVFIKSQNLEGLPLNICITNYTSRRCDVLAKLSKNIGSQQDIFLLQSTDKNGIGYDINLENTGIRRTRAVNDLYSITFVPLPYDLLAGIKSGTETQKTYEGTIDVGPDLTARLTENATLIGLSYPFNKGFKAYVVENDGWKERFFPFIFGEKIENHVIVNSWANGWEIDSAELEVEGEGINDGNSQSSNLNSRLIIVFLPQYLEYIGFLVLGSTFAILGFLALKPQAFIKFRTKSSLFFEKKTEIIRNKLHLRQLERSMNRKVLEPINLARPKPHF